MDSRRRGNAGECGDETRVAVACDEDVRLQSLLAGRICCVPTTWCARTTSPFLRVGERDGAELDPAGEPLIVTCSQGSDDGVPPAESRTWMDPEPAASATHAEALGQTTAVIVPEEQLLAVRCWRARQVTERPSAAGAEVTLPSAEGAPTVRARVAAAWTADAVWEASGADCFEEVIELGRVDARSIHGPDFSRKSGQNHSRRSQPTIPANRVLGIGALDAHGVACSSRAGGIAPRRRGPGPALWVQQACARRGGAGGSGVYPCAAMRGCAGRVGESCRGRAASCPCSLALGRRTARLRYTPSRGVARDAPRGSMLPSTQVFQPVARFCAARSSIEAGVE